MHLCELVTLNLPILKCDSLIFEFRNRDVPISNVSFRNGIPQTMFGELSECTMVDTCVYPMSDIFLYSCLGLGYENKNILSYR